MTDSRRGMHASSKGSLTLFRATLPTALLAGMIAVAGCGGSGSGSGSAPAPVKKTSSTPGGVVSAEGTLGLVGPAGRSTANKQQFEDKSSKISPNANQKTNAQKHGVAAADACTDSGITPSDDNIDQLNAMTLCLVNAERADNGLPALNRVPQLDQSAQGMCQRMITEHFFAHVTPDGKNIVDRIQPTGYIPNGGDWVVGENLAWGSGGLSTPQSIVNGWMNSPGHRANILAPDYKDIGLAACNGSPLTTTDGGTVYVNNFGARSGADLNATLPSEGNSNAANTATVEVAGTKATAAAKQAKARKARARKARAKKARAKRRSACVHRARKAHSSRRRAAAIKRCRHI